MEIGGLTVTVKLQRWVGSESGRPLGPTFHLELDHGAAFGEDRFESLMRGGFSDWLVQEGDEWPTEGEIRTAIEEAEPGLLDDIDSDRDHVREQ